MNVHNLNNIEIRTVLLLFFIYFPLCRCDLLAYWLLGGSGGEENIDPNTRLIVLMLEGFRHDFVDIFDKISPLNGFRRLKKNGVTADYVLPVFPSNTYPNCHSIVTGLYAEHHGIVDDYMYDEQSQQVFSKGFYDDKSSKIWWKFAEPLWITAEKHDIKTALYWWDGCQVEYGGFAATHCEYPQNSYENPDWELNNIQKRLNDVLDKFLKKKLNLAMFHFRAIEFVGRRYGPDSVEMQDMIKNIDKIISDLQDNILKKKMQNNVVVMVISDHGIAKVNRHPAFIINIENYIDTNEISYMLNRGSFAMIQPKRGKINEVNIKNGILHMLAYKLTFKVVVMVISDHGIAKVNRHPAFIINIENYIDTNEISYMLNRGSFAMIQPKRGKINEIYEELKKANINGLQVFLKNELPENYKIKKGKYVLPIVILAEEGFLINGISNNKQIGQQEIYNGEFGYDPYTVRDMRAIFFARGPGIKHNYVCQPMEVVDHYNIMCHILEIPCLPNNGSWKRIKDLFGGESDITLWDWITTISAILVIVAFGLSAGYKLTRREKKD
ncbi:ectonucleotide pyrophosphatase/phosphodiesterase family member 6-like [Centruroides sculpturatus]|uniref:ectonucleotide pyrophosphatase/phosphodiesterase family member 6-like n=1 Tax=Centruroides sculpturatus TaxID=218467 RepID=UPI000C6ED4C5|nr:ectonucleotide pyrophosphatase/phosphodiesterase family member 6-like [Centruroides sculpturatus]